jgi:hypothetical protein
VGAEWRLIVVLISLITSLITNDVKYSSRFLLDIFLSSLQKNVHLDTLLVFRLGHLPFCSQQACALPHYECKSFKLFASTFSHFACGFETFFMLNFEAGEFLI